MKRAGIIILLVCLTVYGWSQKQLNQYEYWFDNAYSAKELANIAPSASYALSTSIPTSNLSTGLHTFQVRFKDDVGAWSTPTTQFFIKAPVTSGVQPTITGYEFWFDNNGSNKVAQAVTANNSVSLVSSIGTGNLATGLHTFQVRFKDNTGVWSTPTSQFFIKSPVTSGAQSTITNYEYWFDNNTTNKIAQSVTASSSISLVSSISTGNLPSGLHTFQVRFKDNTGVWSVPTSQFFIKSPISSGVQSTITNYEYWFDNNASNKITQAVTASNSISLVSSISTGNLAVGLHTFQARFKDNTGAWSSTTTQFFIKPNITNLGDNKISAYEYWFNDSISRRTHVDVTPIDPLELKNTLLPVNSLITKITKDNSQLIKDKDGNYQFAATNRLHIRFKDIRGGWSSVTDTTFAAIVDDVDLSAFIVNPEANDGYKGWATGGMIGNFIQNTDHWSGKTNPYFNLGYSYQTGWTSTMSQTISGLPAGTYVLKATGRSATETTMTMTVGGVSVNFPANGAVGGEIWEDALAGSSEKSCNKGAGFGWSTRSVSFTTDGSPFVIQVSGTTTKYNQWCSIDNFTLSVNNAASLNVSLPDTLSAARYKGYTLLLTNKKTGSKIPITTTGKQTYTFDGLSPASYYNVSLVTVKGAVIAGIDSIKLVRGNNTVKFTTLKTIVPITLQVLTPAKKNVTDDVSIQWYNAANQYLLQGDSLPDMTAGTVVYYTVSLNKTLGSQLIEPEKQSYTVTNGNNNLVCTLQPVDSVTITGVVKDENRWVMSGASVAVTQLLNGKYAKDFTAQTDKNGKYSLAVYNDSSTVIISYPGYINQTRIYTSFKDSTNLGTTILKPITGVTVTTNFTYTPSVVGGETATTESYYSNYQNVAYQLYNVTKDKAIGEIYVQYPNLIIQDKADVGDQIRMTATSRVGEFSPAQYIITVNQNNKDTANFNLKGLGAIKATYTNSPNSSSVGALYNAQGQQVKKESYSNATITFSSLVDGSYTLVSMANSTYLGSILNLSELTSAGLVLGTDYVSNRVEVKSGVISTISIPSIPALNESKFYYTGANTSFSVNKTAIGAGNYVTLRAKLDFKEQYAGKVTNVNLIVDIPDNCSFIKNSVMIGTALAAYVTEGNRIIVPLNDKINDQIRFCITPTLGGVYAPNAFVKLDVDKKTITQPIGSASFTAKDMSITVPNQTAKKVIPVSGTAAPFSTVSIYDGTTLIGQTTALATGDWMTSCELFEAYNLTTHTISAKILTPAGVTIQTETQKVEYNISTIEVKTVTMINTAHGPSSLALKEYNTVFDFQHPKQTMDPYWYWPSYPDFTFKVDFTNNDTAFVSNVKLYVKTSSNEIVPLTASYDKKKDIWVATSKFHSGSLPVNLSVEYKANSEVLLDNSCVLDINNKFNVISDSFISDANIIENFSNLDSTVLVDSLYNSMKINNLIESDFNKSSYLLYIDSLSNQDLQFEIDSLRESISNMSIYIKIMQNFFVSDKYFDITLDDSTHFVSKSCEGYSKSILADLGYRKIKKINGEDLYIIENRNQTGYVDFSNNIFVLIENHTSSTSALLTRANSDEETFEQKMYKSLDNIKYAYDKLENKIGDLTQKLTVELNKATKNYNEANSIYEQRNIKLKLFEEELNSGNLDPWQYNAKKIEIQTLKSEISDLNSIVKNASKQKGLAALCLKSALPLKKTLSKTLPITTYIIYVNDAISKYRKVEDLKKLLPNIKCPEFENDLKKCELSIDDLLAWVVTYYTGRITVQATTDIVTAGEVVAAPATGGTSLIPAFATVVGKMALDFAINSTFEKNINSSILNIEDQIYTLEYKIRQSDCDGNPDPYPNPNPNPNHGGGNGGGISGNSGSGNVPSVQDPSGYVYEAVSSNRLEGVTATIYCKTKEEDMYGDVHDVITKWDAAPYLQVNPQITDENGTYAWDVPDGLWQVKYEKAGYETMYSDWLPVPPPQLDINVGMKHLIPPTVKKMRGYEEGINIHFDKYMKLSTMTTTQISVSHNGVDVPGAVRMLNQEEGYAADTARYVSKVRFIPNQAFTVGDSVTVTVKSTAQSYAGMKMAADYSLKIAIEKEIKSIVSDSLAEMKIHGNRMVSVTVLPAIASKEKRIKANTASSSIISLNNTEAILDNNGKANFVVNGDLPGGTSVQFAISDVDDLSSITNVNVLLASQVSAPTPSVASGLVPKDTTAVISCATTGAIVYYTTDGSSPDNTSSSRLAYSAPIKINKSLTLKAVATKSGFDDSPIVSYQYRVDTVQNVTASVAPGDVLKDTTVTLSCSTPDAIIYYTTDGTSPLNATGSRRTYLSPVLIDRDLTIGAVACKKGLFDSPVISYNYQAIVPLKVLITRKWDDVLVCNNSEKLFTGYQWYKNDNLLSAETKQYYQELGGLSGSYYVKVSTADGRKGISNTIVVGGSSKSIKVMPNPTASGEDFNLLVNAPSSDLNQAQFTLFSISGAVILRKSVIQAEMTLKGLQSGYYLIQVRFANGESLNEKLIVN